MIFLSLFLAHLLADFVFQPNRLIIWKNKCCAGVLVHALIHLFTMGGMLWFLWPSTFFLAVIGTVALLHLFIDIIKIRLEHQNHAYVRLFFADQTAHFLVLIAAGSFLGALTPIVHNEFLQFIFQPVTLFYCILVIAVTYIYEITRLQFLLEKNTHAYFRPDWKGMLGRLVLGSGLYFGVLGLLSLTGIWF